MLAAATAPTTAMLSAPAIAGEGKAPSLLEQINRCNGLPLVDSPAVEQYLANSVVRLVLT